MADFEITAPDGSVYEITAPDEAAAMSAFNSMIGGQPAPQAPAPAAPVPEGRGNILDPIMDGLFLGGADELRGAVRGGVRSLFTDVPFQQAFQEERDSTRDDLASFQDRNPATAAAAGIAGSLAPAFATGGVGTAVAASRGIAARISTGAAGGTVVGATQGALSADDGSRVDGAVAGGILGAGIGTAIPLAGSGAAKLFDSAAGKNVRRAGAVIRDRLSDVGSSVDEAVRGVADGRILAQQDEGLARLAGDVARARPGAARTRIKNEFERGYQADNAAARNDVVALMEGVDNFPVWFKGLERQRSAAASTAYRDAFNQPFAPSVQLGEFWRGVPGEVFKDAQKLAQAERVPFGKNIVADLADDGSFTIAREPNLREAEIIRRTIKDKADAAFRSGQGSLGAAYKGMERELRGMLDEGAPDLARVRQQYADSKSVEEAASLGRGMANKPADEVEAAVADMTDVEKDVFRRGMASGILNGLDRGGDNLGAARRLFGSERMRGVMQAVMSPEEYDEFAGAMGKRIEFAEARQRVTGNSLTAERLADDDALKRTSGNLTAVGRFASASLPEKANIVVNAMVGLVGRNGIPEEQLDQMAKALVSRNPEGVRAILEGIGEGDARSANILKNFIERESQRIGIGAVAPIGEAAER